ncbi:sugar nucleotide-binding protein [Rivibacter subsaxonicus]|uniref:dTDP-4-dehydrorhamnose reductase n=1 Tax=Rivibacter subsaxonicus TaxID=457575 RepID=A0A4V2FUL8_9BURK|nr:sugar nucleotide-binding protein [Rivibacter subsaxonicus]RZU02466.1 dTDP-4-dehydrorhamnose reductase [Rivibacter subsaxonicus]
MKLLVTGLNGTLAPRLAQAARAAGVDVIGWDRARINPDDIQATQRWLDATRAEAIAHLAMGSADWAARLAAHAAERAMPFVFTSTAMVFDHEPDGPHAPDSARNARDDYGRYKIACEDAVLCANPGATVARIGWQIDPSQPGNNMLMALDQWQARDGCVAASRAWRPACSFMADTAAALLALLQQPRAGVVHLDSNAAEAHSFVAIVAALKARFARDAWILREHEDYRHDQRLAGGARLVPPLSARLPQLAR